MKDYIAIFNEIVDIMHKDYSGCKDKESLKCMKLKLKLK